LHLHQTNLTPDPGTLFAQFGLEINLISCSQSCGRTFVNMQLTWAVLTLAVATRTTSALPGCEAGLCIASRENPRGTAKVVLNASELQQDSIENGQRGMWTEAGLAASPMNAASSGEISKAQQSNEAHQVMPSKDKADFTLHVRCFVESLVAQGRESARAEQRSNQQQQDNQNLDGTRQGKIRAQLVSDNLAMHNLDHHSRIRQDENSDEETSTTISAASASQPQGRQSMIEGETVQERMDSGNCNRKQENNRSDAARPKPTIDQEITRASVPQMGRKSRKETRSPMCNAVALAHKQQQQQVGADVTGQNSSPKQQQQHYQRQQQVQAQSEIVEQ
jgi:hypothetical protein